VADIFCDDGNIIPKIVRQRGEFSQLIEDFLMRAVELSRGGFMKLHATIVAIAVSHPQIRNSRPSRLPEKEGNRLRGKPNPVAEGVNALMASR
jgi:hypothetical protein